MKRAFSVLLISVLLLISLTSCGIADMFGVSQTVYSVQTATPETQAAETDEIPDITVDQIDYSTLDLSKYISLDYKGLEVTSSYEIREITDKILDEELEAIMVYYDYYTIDTSRKTEEGDYADISYKGFMDGEQFSGGTSDNQSILLDKENSGYITGFADGLIGVEPGKTVTLNLVFPDNYSATLAGKAVTFEVTVNGVCKTELTDEIAGKLSNGNANTVAAYRVYFKQYLEEMDRYLQFNDVTEALWNKLPELAVIKEYPAQQVQYYHEYYSNYIGQMAAAYGVSYSSMLLQYGYTEESLEEMAKEIVRDELIENYICKCENIEITDDVYKEYLNNLVESYNAQGYTYSASEIEALFESYYGEGYLKQKAKTEKISDVIYSYAKVTYVPAE